MEYEGDCDTNNNFVLGTIPKGLVERLEELVIRGRVETIQTTALLRSARIMRRVLETWGGLLSLRPSANAHVKNSQVVTIIQIIPVRRLGLVLINKKKRTYLSPFYQITEWNMKIVEALIMIRALGRIPKNLEKRQRELEILGKFEIIHSTTLLRSTRIL